MYADNDYCVDDWQNGKFMPYASMLPEWSATSSTTERLRLRRIVMEKAQMQLHQGPHSFKAYVAGGTGYKSRVDEYLKAITNNSIGHYKAEPPCPDCKSKEQAGYVAPRRNVVRFVHKASERLEIDINIGKIFVSRHAAEYAAAGGAMG